MRNISIYFLLVYLLVSCENLVIKDLELEETGFEKQLVVQLLLETGDSIVSALISENSSVLATENDIMYIQDAEVSLYRDGSLVGELEQLESTLYHFIPDEPLNQPGEYSIEVSNTPYSDASANTSIPPSVEIRDLKFDPEAGTDPLEMSPVGEVTFTINDPTGRNYYSVDLTSEGETLDTFIWDTDTIISVNQAVYAYAASTQLDPNVSLSEYGNYIFINDQVFDGQEIEIKLRYVFFENGELEEGKEIKDFLKLKITSHSEESFNYISSLERYESATDFAIFSEPVSVFTNIENGLGVFAGANSSEFIFE